MTAVLSLGVVTSEALAQKRKACLPACPAGTVCDDGQCVAAAPAPAAAAPAAAPVASADVAAPTAAAPRGVRRFRPEDAPPSAHEASLATWVALVGAAVELGTGASSAAWYKKRTAALVIESLHTGVFLTTGLVSQAFAGMSRSHPDVKGSIGLRISGWIGYGATGLFSIAMLMWSSAEPYTDSVTGQQFYTPVPIGVVLGTTLLGTATLTAFALDAFITAAQARAVAAQYTAVPGSSASVSVVPSFGFAQGAHQELHPTFGVAGRF